jgi:hypothetical protein
VDGVQTPAEGTGPPTWLFNAAPLLLPNRARLQSFSPLY